VKAQDIWHIVGLRLAKSVKWMSMTAILKKWEEAWNRLLKAREKLESFGHDYPIVRHILILDNIKPGDTISFDSGLLERPPPVEVRKAIQNFDRALRHEDSVFRQLPEPDQAVAAAKRKFD
jgi:hypothetical protein